MITLKKQDKECHICGSKNYRILSDDTIICGECGSHVGYYSMSKKES